MKPKFALDLSHEGINLLHRSKGGWSLVGSVELDDPEMGAHLADLRRRAAALESGGFTCKIIIPNSQVLYTTVEAPGPDDIAREVQIRAGLDGLTPYPVGELVFDWRAAGERARVAVLARETMDEAETFAVEHKFNPVSFVARPSQGSFSGEPFFGKTRAAAKILGPSERVEPDASPVPRKPQAVEPQTAFPSGALNDPAEAARPLGEAAPHSPGDLSWQPPSESAPAADNTSPPAATPAPTSDPIETPPPQARDDDPFAELDAIQAELSGNPDSVPAFRSRTSRPAARPAPSGDSADQPAPPPLAPFPPTSDEAGATPPPSQPARKAGASGKSSGSDKSSPAAKADASPAQKPEPSRTTERPSANASGASDAPTRPYGHEQAPQTPPPRAGGQPTSDAAKDDLPPQPGVAFSTRRGGNGEATTATPTARSASPEPAETTPAKAPTEPAKPAQVEPSTPSFRKDASPSDRRRAEMAAALSKPLPGKPAKTSGDKAPEQPASRGTLSSAVRGAAGGLRSFGHGRGTRKDGAQPTDTSMAELMRGAESSDARLSPDQDQDGPVEVARDVTAKDTGESDTAASATSKTAPTAHETPKTVLPAERAAPGPSAPAEETKQIPAAPLEPKADPKQLDKKTAPPTPAGRPDTPKILARASTVTPDTPKPPANEAEAMTVFGARRIEEKRGGRKYLGVILTLVLLLAMAVIAMWSSFFVEDTDPGLFNPDAGATAPETPDPASGSALTGDTTDTPPPDAQSLPEETAPEVETATDIEPAPTPQVLTEEEAEALFAETQVWQRAPETLGEPFTPDLEMGAVSGPGTARNTIANPAEIGEPDVPDVLGSAVERAAPLPPPPADTVFDLGENGLVNPSPDGTVSPSGIVIFEGAPDVVAPARPGTPPPPEVTPEDATLDDAALEQAVDQAVEAAAALTTDAPAAAALPEVPDLRPAPRPEIVPAPEADAPDVPDDDAQLDVVPDADAQIVTAAADAASIEAAVDAAASSFVDATDLAVARSPKPTRRPDDIDQIVNAAMARAAAAPPAPVAPATTTPAIPTSANVANQATTPNAINLREINLLGISGPSNARRALVRMENGRYITVKVGDRLDGGRVTSITSDGLTYQKGSRNLSLQLLPLG